MSSSSSSTYQYVRKGKGTLYLRRRIKKGKKRQRDRETHRDRERGWNDDDDDSGTEFHRRGGDETEERARKVERHLIVIIVSIRAWRRFGAIFCVRAPRVFGVGVDVGRRTARARCSRRLPSSPRRPKKMLNAKERRKKKRRRREERRVERRRRRRRPQKRHHRRRRRAPLLLRLPQIIITITITIPPTGKVSPRSPPRRPRS